MPKLGMEPVRRQALIVAAIDAIHDRGMAQVTVADIARRAGVSAGLAHHYFGGKDQLLLATMRHLLRELGREVRARLAQADGPEARLSAIIQGNFAPDQFRPEVISTWLAFYVQAQTDRQAARLLRVYHRRLKSNLVHAMWGTVDRERAAEAAEAAAALIDGVWLRRSLSGGAPDAAGAARLVESTVLCLVRRHA
jgi:TetR/AcrR family transcriptional regulator, transcriptional repressor of bet genes